MFNQQPKAQLEEWAWQADNAADNNKAMPKTGNY